MDPERVDDSEHRVGLVLRPQQRVEAVRVVDDGQRAERDDADPRVDGQNRDQHPVDGPWHVAPRVRDSSAMFETVSIPVYATIASDSAKISWL